jgi:hypothetical protein
MRSGYLRIPRYYRPHVRHLLEEDGARCKDYCREIQGLLTLSLLFQEQQHGPRRISPTGTPDPVVSSYGN